MAVTINGLHHVTAISGSAQRNLDFYAKLLGLRFVKKTVNFDDPSVYHLYYGDRVGTPGSVLTFFPWEHMARGRPGAGETSLTAFAVPADSLPFWRARLDAAGVPVIGPDPHFETPRLLLEDPDGLALALVAAEDDDARTPWTTQDLDADVAIRGFAGVALTLADLGPTAEVLEELFGYARVAREGTTVRYAAPHARHARVVDLIEAPGTPRALLGTGSVHHVAFAVPDRAAQMAVRGRLLEAGHQVTPQIDRNYFYSIYFRSPGGVLFEVATDEPGFAVDEPLEELGQHLKLPRQHEHLRARLERSLPPLRI